MKILFNIPKSINVGSVIILANVFGVIIYLYLSVPLWAPDSLANTSGAGVGTPIIWGLTALPVLLFFMLVNLIIIIGALVVYIKSQTRILQLSYIPIPVAWFIVIYLDFSHHWTL